METTAELFEGATLADGRAVFMRRGTAHDLERVREHYHAVILGRNPWYPFPVRPGSLDVWLERAGYLDFTRHLHWLVLVDGQVVGHFMFQRNDVPSIGLEGIATVYLTIAPALRGRGVAEAVKDSWAQYFTPALRAEGVRRLVAHSFSENVASVRLLIRMGFTWEGTLRQHMRARDGAFHDVQVFGQLVTEAPPCVTCERGVARLRRLARISPPDAGPTS